jgi:hypothetical protein
MIEPSVDRTGMDIGSGKPRTSALSNPIGVRRVLAPGGSCSEGRVVARGSG